MTARSRSLSAPSIPRSNTMYGTVYSGDSPSNATAVSQSMTQMVDTPSFTKSMTDVVTPGFKKLVSRGAIINNPYSSVTNLYVPPQPSSFSLTQIKRLANGVDQGQTWSGSWAPSSGELGAYLDPNTDPGWAAGAFGMMDEMVTKAHANVPDMNILALATAAEGRKTVASVSSILLRVVRVMNDMRRLNIQHLRKEVSRKELADRYMEIRYALRPLMYDLKGVAKAYNAKTTGPKRSTSRARDEYKFSRSDTITIPAPAWGGNFSIARKVEGSFIVRAGVMSTVTSPETTKWGLNQIAESAWELLPFSFIIDWFFNVGSKIAAWVPNFGIHELASWVTVEQTVTQTNSLVSYTKTPNPHYNYADVGSWSGSSKSQTTIAKQRYPKPSMTALPNLTVRLDPLKMLDLAIITKLLRLSY